MSKAGDRLAESTIIGSLTRWLFTPGTEEPGATTKPYGGLWVLMLMKSLAIRLSNANND